MRVTVLAALVTAALGVMATSQIMAAPASGDVIRQAAITTSPITRVPYAMRRYCAQDGAGCAARAGEASLPSPTHPGHGSFVAATQYVEP